MEANNEKNNKEEIISNVRKWVNIHLPNFSFRKYQLEYIVEIIYSIVYNNKSVNLIEAPTGSGKSIMVIIMAGVLNSYYEKKSFILVSDLYLWQQYYEAIERYGLSSFGYLKGTWNNYTCGTNGVDLSLAPCRLAMVPFKSLCNKKWANEHGWECAGYCDYLRERERAIKSGVTLMTYQLYFPYLDDATIHDSCERVFPKRDVVFCDECHNVPDLCQTYSTIVMDQVEDLKKYREFIDFIKGKDELQEYYNSIPGWQYECENTYGALENLYSKITKLDNENKTELANLMYNMWDVIHPFFALYVEDRFYNGWKEITEKRKKAITRKEASAINIAKWIDKFEGSLHEHIKYLEGYTNTNDVYVEGDIQPLVISDNRIEDDNKKLVWPENPIVSFKYAKEDVLVFDDILKNQPYNVMLSATIGDHLSFDTNIGTKYLKDEKDRRSVMYRIPSTFDFSNSPIYYVHGNKMSRDCINESFGKNAAAINSILKSPKHMNEKGIIHTGSYKNAYELLNMLDDDVKKRIHIYSTAKEKQDILLDYMDSQNGVLIGPTLTEGIDFPEDGCRFIIIFKIPYPYLGDNLVKAKCKLYPKWYNSETSSNVIQGIGRGNRTPTDWSTTYILDGCFSGLYQKTFHQYPDEMKARIQVITNRK